MTKVPENRDQGIGLNGSVKKRIVAVLNPLIVRPRVNPIDALDNNKSHNNHNNPNCISSQTRPPCVLRIGLTLPVRVCSLYMNRLCFLFLLF